MERYYAGAKINKHNNRICLKMKISQEKPAFDLMFAILFFMNPCLLKIRIVYCGKSLLIERVFQFYTKE